MANLSIRNLPKEIYEKLKKKAKRNKRSLNSEIIYSLVDSTLNAIPPEDSKLDNIVKRVLKNRIIVKNKDYTDPVKLIREMRDGE